MDTDLTLKELQDKLLPPPYNPIIPDGETEPIHKNKKGLLKDEFEFRNLPKYCFDDKSFFGQVEISNKGRIKINREIKEQLLNKNSELIIDIPGKKYNPQKVWTLVALTWRDGKDTKDYYDRKSYRIIVHHLDNNGYNNDYNNLLWVTPSKHTAIHIKGIWKKENEQIIFFENKFKIKTINGIFQCNDLGWNNITKKYDINLVFYFNNTQMTFSCDYDTYKVKLNNLNKKNNFLNGTWERSSF
jgi:hypothetical protein